MVKPSVHITGCSPHPLHPLVSPLPIILISVLTPVPITPNFRMSPSLPISQQSPAFLWRLCCHLLVSIATCFTKMTTYSSPVCFALSFPTFLTIPFFCCSSCALGTHRGWNLFLSVVPQIWPPPIVKGLGLIVHKLRCGWSITWKKQQIVNIC